MEIFVWMHACMREILLICLPVQRKILLLFYSSGDFSIKTITIIKIISIINNYSVKKKTEQVIMDIIHKFILVEFEEKYLSSY